MSETQPSREYHEAVRAFLDAVDALQKWESPEQARLRMKARKSPQTCAAEYAALQARAAETGAVVEAMHAKMKGAE